MRSEIPPKSILLHWKLLLIPSHSWDGGVGHLADLAAQAECWGLHGLTGPLLGGFAVWQVLHLGKQMPLSSGPCSVLSVSPLECPFPTPESIRQQDIGKWLVCSLGCELESPGAFAAAAQGTTPKSQTKYSWKAAWALALTLRGLPGDSD